VTPIAVGLHPKQEHHLGLTIKSSPAKTSLPRATRDGLYMTAHQTHRGKESKETIQFGTREICCISLAAENFCRAWQLFLL
jgi:hypothetical protein